MAYLAEKTRLAKGTLYLYFPTKESLYLSICEEELDAWLDTVHESLAAADGPLGDTALVNMLLSPLADRSRLGINKNASMRQVKISRGHDKDGHSRTYLSKRYPPLS